MFEFGYEVGLVLRFIKGPRVLVLGFDLGIWV